MRFAGFDSQPTLTGRGVQLRPLSSDDHDGLFRAASDPLIWEQHPSRTRHLRDIFDPYFRHLLRTGTALGIWDTESERLIGTSSFYVAPDDPPALSIGFTFLERAYWGGDMNRRVKGLMLDHIFATTDTGWFHIGTQNVRSRRATEKLGAVYSHTRQLDLGTGVAMYDCLRLDRDTWQGQAA